LHKGKCVASMACLLAGLVPIGDRRLGRACIGTSTICNMAKGCLCDSEAAGDDCQECGLVPEGSDRSPNLRCYQCPEDKYLVPPGRCVQRRKCEPKKISIIPGLDPIRMNVFGDSYAASERHKRDPRQNAPVRTESCSCDHPFMKDGKPVTNAAGEIVMNTNCDRCEHFRDLLPSSWQGTQVVCKRCKPGSGFRTQERVCYAKDQAGGAPAAPETPSKLVLDPFNNKAVLEPPYECVLRKKSTTGKKCRCNTKNPKQVLRCSVDASADGVNTIITVTACTEKMFLFGETCKVSCPQSGKYTSYGVRTSFRSCEKPFVCDQLAGGTPSVQGRPCECEDPRIAICRWKANNAFVSTDNGIDRRSTSVSEIIKCKPGFILKANVAKGTQWCGKE